MAHATLSSKNQIVIPKEAREALGIKSGDKMVIVVRGKTVIVLQKPDARHPAIRGLAKSPLWPALSRKGTPELGLDRLRAFLRRHRRFAVDASVFIYQLENGRRMNSTAFYPPIRISTGFLPV